MIRNSPRRQHLVPMQLLTLGALTLLLSACAVEPPGPVSLVLTRDTATIHLLGTIHKVPPDELESVEALTGVFGETIATSDAVFKENPQTPTVEDRDEYLAKSYGDTEGDGRLSVGRMIDRWSEERRAAFLQNLSAFPLMNHVGRQEIFLSLRPWAADRYLDGMLDAHARIDAHEAIEDWVINQARAAGVPIHGLHTSAEKAAIFDSLDQQILLEGIESRLSSLPDSETLAAAWIERLDLTYASWAEGSFGALTENPVEALYRTEGDCELDETCLEYEEALYRRREELWIRTLERYFQEDGHESATVFVAVGASHINREAGSFVQLLQDAGWEVTSVSSGQVDIDYYAR
jgi:uncharacterized protein YbaP (TraB family)